MPADRRRVLMDSARALWPPPHRLQLTRSSRTPPDAVDLLVVPRLRTALWLLPADRPTAAAALVRADAGERNRGIATAIAAAHRRGALRRLPLARVRVRAPAGTTGVLDDLLPDADPRLTRAVRLGSWSPARSLVVAMLDAAGDTVAYAKVGLGDSGRDAVRAETAALLAVAQRGLRLVRPPRVLHVGGHGDLGFVTISALAPAARSDRGPRPPTDAMAELAGSGAARTAPVTDSAWFAGLGARVDTVRDRQVRDRLRTASDALRHRAGAVPVRLGAWHGDWTGWNMAWDGDRVLLWDWEHFADQMPVGADPLHFRAQQLRVGPGPLERRERLWWEEAESMVRTLPGTVPGSWPVVAAAYLLEVNLRYVLDRQGTARAHEVRPGWGLPLLRAATVRLDRLDRLAGGPAR